MVSQSQAVIFDLNGVIVNDERIHQQSWVELFGKHNLSFTEEQYKQNIFGRTEKDALSYAFGSKLPAQEIESYLAERLSLAVNLLNNQIPVAAGLFDLLDRLKNKNIPLAIATSSRTPYARHIIDHLSLSKYFSSIVTAEEVTFGKPHPEIYLTAAKRLMIYPTRCTAIEDSLSGIVSAKQAGMYTVALTSTHTSVELSQADQIINSFTNLNLSILNLY